MRLSKLAWSLYANDILQAMDRQCYLFLSYILIIQGVPQSIDPLAQSKLMIY